MITGLENFPYTNFHDLNLDWILSVIKEVKETYPAKFEELMQIKVNAPTTDRNGQLGDYLISNGDGTTSWKPLDMEIESEIIEQVNNWLEEHPEATTTVQDGAITFPKLDENLQSVVYNPDVFPGTDAVKLQTAIDAAIYDDYSSILIDRVYDITGSTLQINKRLSTATSRYRQKMTFIGVHGGAIVKTDGGYIFSGSQIDPDRTHSAGDIQFFNMTFKGALSAVDTIKSDYCSVFDCHRLIRITTLGCSFFNCGAVFDGTECISATSNMQQCTNFGDLVSYCYCYYKLNTAWCVYSFGCTVEQSDYAYYCMGGNANSLGTVTSMHIKDCVLEGCTYPAICAIDPDPTSNPLGGLTDIVIDGCYFEKNTRSGSMDPRRDIYLHAKFCYGVTIKNCRFSPTATSAYRCVDLLVRNLQYDIDNLSTGVNDANVTMVYLDMSQGGSTILYRLYYHNIYCPTNTVLTNEAHIFLSYHDMIPAFYDGIVDSHLNPNLNSIVNQVGKNMIVIVKSTDNVTNAPPGETQGILETESFPQGGAVQRWYSTGSKNAAWFRIQYRVNTTTLAWHNWQPLTGAYTFILNNLSDGDSITLPVSGYKAVINGNIVYSSGASNNIIIPAIRLTASNTAFTFHAVDASTGNATARSDMMVAFTVTPDLSA